MGGHSHTVTIDYDDTPIPVDIGFIIYNEINYPELTAMLRLLDVETMSTSMSFALSANHGSFEWKGSRSGLQMLAGLFVQPSNALSPTFWLMLRDVLRFNKNAVLDLKAGRLASIT